MSSLREALQEYLGLRRSLGFKMHDAGVLLPCFVRFLEERQASVHHYPPGARVGSRSVCPTGRVGQAPLLRARLRPLPQCQR